MKWPALFPAVLPIIVLFCNCLNFVNGRTGVLVATESGKVRGTVSLSRIRREFYSWKGIPFAEPPLGRLRFADPVPIKPWKGTLNAIDYGPSCVQISIGPWPTGNEDCLKLNIFTPAGAFERGKRLPVMIFIHGGLFATLSSQSFAPDYFMDENVVLVTINYRLGSFGFLSTGDDVVRGNMGLKDQSLAIRWVNENIEAFGGDRNRITIFGQSAGGASVHYQILSPLSTGLFHKAISQSGSALAPWALQDNPVKQAKDFARKLDCPTDSSLDMVECLRSRSISEIIAVRHKAKILTEREITRKDELFLPVVEKINDNQTFLAEHPKKLQKDGNFAKIPWLTGINSAEGLLVAVPFVMTSKIRWQIGTNWTGLAKEILMLSPEENTCNGFIRESYFGQRSLDSLNVLPKYIQMMSDRFFNVPFFKSVNSHAASSAPVFAYHFSRSGPSPFKTLLRIDSRYPRLIGVIRAQTQRWIDNIRGVRSQLGVGHYDEMFLLTPTPRLYYVGQSHQDYAFSRDMVKLWVSFANNSTGLAFRDEVFPSYTPGIEDPALFQLDEQPELVQLGLQNRVGLWDDIAMGSCLKRRSS